MAGKRIIELTDKAHWDPLYEMVVDFTSGGLAIPEALAITLAMVGNAYFQGSVDNSSFHDEVEAADTFFRFSTDGGIVWKKLTDIVNWDVQVDGVEVATITGNEYVNFVGGTDVTITAVDDPLNGVTLTFDYSGTPSTGVDNFIDLTDTDPTTYVGFADQVVVVNPEETGLTFKEITLFEEPPDDGDTYGRYYDGDSYEWTTINALDIIEGPGIDVRGTTTKAVTLDFHTLTEDVVSDRSEEYIMLGYYDLNTTPDPETGLYIHYKDTLKTFSDWNIWNAKYLRDWEISETDPVEGQVLKFISNKWTPSDSATGDGDCFWARNTSYGMLYPETITDEVLVGSGTRIGDYGFQVDTSTIFRLTDGISQSRPIYFATNADTTNPLFVLTGFNNDLTLWRYSSTYLEMLKFDYTYDYVKLGAYTGLKWGDTSYAIQGMSRYHDGHFQGYNATNTWVNLDETGTTTDIDIIGGDGLTITVDGDTYTISMGTPTTVTSTSTNITSGTTHTHALDTVLSGTYPLNGPGTYTEPVITVDSKGRIVAIEEGVGEGDCLWTVDTYGIHYIGTSPRLNVGIGSNSLSSSRLLVKSGSDNTWALEVDASIGAAGGLYVRAGATGGWMARFFNNTTSINGMNLAADGRLYLPTYTGTTMDPVEGVDTIVRYLGVDAWGKVFTTEITGGGGGTVLTKWSVTGSGALGNEIRLTNDEENPGTTMYYGTDETGTKGWHDLTITGDNYVDSATWDAGTDTLTLGRTGDLADITVNIPMGGGGGFAIFDKPFEFCVVEGTTETFTIDIEATYSYTINSLVIECDGTITDVTIKKDGVTVGTIASVTTKTTGTFTTGNTVLIGQRVSLTVTSAAATYIMRGKLNITRIAER